MVRETTLGQLLIERALPTSMRGKKRVLDSAGVKELFQELADNHPEQYREVGKALSDVGRHAATESGGMSVGVNHLLQPDITRTIRRRVQAQLQSIYAEDLPEAEKQAKVIAVSKAAQTELSKAVYQHALDTKNPIGLQAKTGVRGNAANVNSLLGADMLYMDNTGKEIPLPVLHNYSEGLTPAEYFAGAFGARQGVYAVKRSTADSGYYAKQLNQMAHRLLVSAKDSEDYDPETLQGLPVDTDDQYNAGALLAYDVGGYKRNQLLTPRILKELKAAGHDQILVRSPIVGGPKDGGVYAYDTGVRERNGGLSPIGDYVGLAGAQAIGEIVTQSALSAKHCLVKGTMVRMADFAIKAIEDVRVGDWVLGSSMLGVTRAVQVLQTFYNGPRACFEYAYRDGSKHSCIFLQSTCEHKVLVLRRVSSQLDSVRNSVPQLLPAGKDTGKVSAILAARREGFVGNDEPYALVCGLLLGDGCYTAAVDSVNFSCFDPLLAKEIDDTLSPLNLKLKKLKGHPGYYKFSMLQDNYYENRCEQTGRMKSGPRNPIRKWLTSRGMFGKYAHEKTLPPDIAGWSDASVLQLISGYFVTDGSVYVAVSAKHKYPCQQINLVWTSTSKELLIGLKSLLQFRFGIYCDFSTGKLGNRRRVLHKLLVRGRLNVDRFLAIVPLYGVKRATAAVSLVAADTKRIASHNLCRKVGVKPLGLLPTYDIEVDHPDHLFVLGNGMVVSNSGGVVGSTAGGLSGFKAFNNLIQVPKVFPGGATHAQLDGRVMGIKPAPQGGNYVTVDSTEHHVPQDVALKVKLHDMVEAGDVLSDGLPNPGELVKHKGVGDGRKHFVQIMADVAKRSGTRADRRNIELVARGLINHVRLTDEYEDGVPGETYPYQFLEATWQPREGHTASTPDSAKGQYLERPALHYTVGTKIRPSVIANLNKFGVKQVYTHKDPPPFEPEMIRAMASVSEDKDWMTNMLGSYQKTSLLDAVHRGRTADTAGTSYVPAMAQGQPFGIQGASKGWDPKAPQMDAPDVTAVDKPIKPIGTASKSLLDDDGFDD